MFFFNHAGPANFIVMKGTRKSIGCRIASITSIARRFSFCRPSIPSIPSIIPYAVSVL